VKWEYSLPSGVVVKEALARASAFAQSDPPGPVYMMLPRETLAEQWDDVAMPAYPASRFGGVQAGGIEQARVDAIAGQLMAAENPVAFTAYLGREPQAVAVLDRLARACGIRIAEFNSIDLNIPQDSPCFAGIDPLPLLETADLGLLLDTDVPFIPQAAKRAGAMKWIQIDIDPLKADFPMWGFATDLRIQGDCAIVLQQVLDAVEARADDDYRRRVAARITSWDTAREVSVKRRATASANTGFSGALSPAFVFATLNAKLSLDDIVINEAIRNGPILQEHITRTKPQSYVGLAGGGLGFSGGMALGLKLARPDRRVVQVIGDGGYHFSSPDGVYAVAQQYQIPIFTVVLDNGGWQAVKSAVQRVYPKGVAAETNEFQSRLRSGRQGEARDFSAVARAFGAHGECVTEPDDLAAAIDRCLAALDDGKAAVLHVHITPL
jgi:acetolactate synthase-1/2/3 large subunit